MRMYDVIEHKRDGQALSDEEIHYFIQGYVAGDIPDYQAAALCMAIFFQGMNAHETATLTKEMVASGETFDLSAISGIKVDKHSTGGVGDKTSLIVAPIVASCGIRMAKMSGRGLGHTGGTLDKLESIPGFQTTIDQKRFIDIVEHTGAAIIGQTGNLVPADKKLYALRDVTATVNSLSLIASSIMSKKIAAGADKILLDVKCGSGAFMKTAQDARALAQAMVEIGENVGRHTVALITNMDLPLGMCIGNALEICEVCDILQNKGPQDLRDLCINLAGNLLYLAGKGELDACLLQAQATLEDGRAFAKFKEMVAAQQGDATVLDNPYTDLLQNRSHTVVVAQQSGYIAHMDTEQIGIACVALGAGRAKKEDDIDYSAGIILKHKTGDFVEAQEPIAELFATTTAQLEEAQTLLKNAIRYTEDAPEVSPLILDRVAR